MKVMNKSGPSTDPCGLESQSDTSIHSDSFEIQITKDSKHKIRVLWVYDLCHQWE